MEGVLSKIMTFSLLVRNIRCFRGFDTPLPLPSVRTSLSLSLSVCVCVRERSNGFDNEASENGRRKLVHACENIVLHFLASAADFGLRWFFWEEKILQVAAMQLKLGGM